MSSKDKVSKSVWGLFEFTKDTIKKNIFVAKNNEQLTLDNETLDTLFKLIDASISEGFNKGHDVMLNEVMESKKN